MRRPSFTAILILLFLFCLSAHAGSGKIVKVLPHYLDREGRHTLFPSLYERDAYQAELRANPHLRSGIRFDVQWRARQVESNRLRLRVELRGVSGNTVRTKILEQFSPKKSWFENWAALVLEGEEYKAFGELNAWRASLWEGDTLLAEYKSFLW
jgi:hypothetical protein